MPYIAIKGYPKDDATKKRVVEKINQIFLEEWGCPQQAISILLEEVSPENWDEEIAKKQIEPKKEKMMIYNGEKNYS